MKNNGLFSSLFIEELKDSVMLDDAAQGRMATLAQTWRTRNTAGYRVPMGVFPETGAELP